MHTGKMALRVDDGCGPLAVGGNGDGFFSGPLQTERKASGKAAAPLQRQGVARVEDVRAGFG